MNELIGKKVIIYSASGGADVRDVGILESVDGTWFKLRKENHEVLFFSAYMIRIIKPFDPI